MDNKRANHISKLLSLVLRHKPDEIGITLDEAGWTDIDALLDAMAKHDCLITREELDYVVRTNEKKRFAFHDDGRRIRANQGHSVKVDLGYEPTQPPDVLFHGTVERNLDSIRKDGIMRGRRHHVHLSPERDTAHMVGGRRGQPVILRVKSGAMHRDGFLFYHTDNNVWLTDKVPPQYVEEDHNWKKNDS